LEKALTNDNERLKDVTELLGSAKNDPEKYFVVFDLDGTLTNYNTTYDFIGYLLLHINPSKYALYVLAIPLFLMTDLIRKVIRSNLDISKLFALKFIKGISQNVMYKVARTYSSYVLKDIKSRRKSILELIENCSRNYKVFIISKTLDPLKFIGQMLTIQIITSKIGYVDLKVESLEYDINKKLVIEKLAKFYQLHPLLIVSDDKEDMLEIFPIKVLVKNSRGVVDKFLRCRFPGKELLRYEK